MDYTPPAYTPRRRQIRHRPRHSLLENPLDNIVPSTDTITSSFNYRATLGTARRSTITTASSTTSRRRNLPASSFDPDCPFSFQPPKKRKIEDYSRPQAGNKLMKLSLAYCDGGTYEGERYRVGNMLVDDESVYCTERYSCNIVLQHETRQPFTLEYLEIKAPPHGFTSPVSEGVIAVTDEDFNPVVEKIACYGRMIPLRKRSKRRPVDRMEEEEDELSYLNPSVRYSRRRDQEAGEEVEEEEEEDEAEQYAGGERLTEFDVVAEYRGDGDEEEDKEEEEEEVGDDIGEHEVVEGGNIGETDLEEDPVELESDGDDETITPATTTGSMPWPSRGSRRLPRTTDLDNDGDGESGNQHDCPYEITGEEEEGEEDEEPTDSESSDYELRRWFLRNSTEERRRMRRRREEAEAEIGLGGSDSGSRGEAYMRFQLRDNKTFIVFNPPRYCKSVVLKLWGSKIDNVDIRSILGYGFYGKRVFPAIEMR
ncbi:hypothetical protein TWF730_005819 [Orbilia blumenaviensis]|uniref:Uncharacterized protein n=1 Tax=Orbilia blumenaviensis TaxID=1796055 RepID=A0AAV9VJI0_9PEZI